MKTFYLACAMELSLLGVAWPLCAWLGLPLLADFAWTLPGLFAGIAGALPALAAFVWLLRSSHEWLQSTQRFLEEFVRPFFGPWSNLQLALISVAAGVCEEILFRSLLQSYLNGLMPWVPALLLTSVLFGCAHAITFPYAIVTSLLAGYLGGLWILTGNLLVPILTHALYDFAALLYFLRIQRKDST